MKRVKYVAPEKKTRRSPHGTSGETLTSSLRSRRRKRVRRKKSRRGNKTKTKNPRKIKKRVALEGRERPFPVSRVSRLVEDEPS